MDRLATSHVCPACGRLTLPGQLICSIDVLLMASRAAKAYDAVKAHDPSLDADRLVVAAIAYIESGHAEHVAPQMGCPFCILRA